MIPNIFRLKIKDDPDIPSVTIFRPLKVGSQTKSC